MATYISLISLTDQGIRNVEQSAKRADEFRSVAEKSGAKVTGVYWTLGTWDGVLIVEAPDDATFTALALSLASLGNVKTQSMRAFDTDEFGGILAKMT
jgi:uncharacterized protein with GYD domain